MPTNGFSIKPLKNKLLAGEQNATELNPSHLRASFGFQVESFQKATDPFILVAIERLAYLQQEGVAGGADRRFWSMFPLTRVPLWYWLFEPQPPLEFIWHLKSLQEFGCRSSGKNSQFVRIFCGLVVRFGFASQFLLKPNGEGNLWLVVWVDLDLNPWLRG